MWILIVGIMIDQISKYLVCGLKEPIIVIPNILSLEYVENYGAVFGLMQGSNYILAVVSALLCIGIIGYMFSLNKNNKNINIAWYMILAGGIGNLIDRIVRGYVVDFIATPFIATFNIADSLVVIGIILLLFKEFKSVLKNR